MSCDGNKPFQDLSDYIAKLKGAEPAKVDPKKPVAASVKPPVSTKYESKTRRSPFEVREITNTKNRTRRHYGGVVRFGTQNVPGALADGRVPRDWRRPRPGQDAGRGRSGRLGFG